MPPCESVLLNKIKRTQNVARMIKLSGHNVIDLPKAIDGYFKNEKNEYALEYFPGCPYPENVADLMTGNFSNNNYSTSNSDEDFCDLSSSDEEYIEDFEDDDWK